MDKFSKVYMSIRNFMPEIAMHHLVSAIQPGWFTVEIDKNSPLPRFWWTRAARTIFCTGRPSRK